MNRRRFMTQCALGSVGLAAFVQGCQPPTQTGSAIAADADPDGHVSDTKMAAAPAAPPAIDQTPPAAFETATFALG